MSWPAEISVRDDGGFLVDTLTAENAGHAAALLDGLPDGWHAEMSG